MNSDNTKKHFLIRMNFQNSTYKFYGDSNKHVCVLLIEMHQLCTFLSELSYTAITALT